MIEDTAALGAIALFCAMVANWIDILSRVP
jgi:hypothetical protein